MKLSISRSSILTALVAAVLLAALPGAVRRYMQTRDPYLFSVQFFQDMIARFSGPGRLRFIMQPAVALFLGMRDGKSDARMGRPPFLSALMFHAAHRPALLRSAFESIRELVLIAILLDIIAQFLIFRDIHPGAALLLGPMLISVPYALSRALANRIASRPTQRAPVVHPR